MRRVRVTVLSPGGGEYRETVPVADDYELPEINDRDEWIILIGADGSEWAFPPRLVVGIVLEPAGKKTARGGRIN